MDYPRRSRRCTPSAGMTTKDELGTTFLSGTPDADKHSSAVLGKQSTALAPRVGDGLASACSCLASLLYAGAGPAWIDVFLRSSSLCSTEICSLSSMHDCNEQSNASEHCPVSLSEHS